MSKLTEQLRTIGIFNPHNLVEKGHPFIVYTSGKSLFSSGACWTVHVKNGSRWNHYNMKLNWRAAVAAPLARCKELFPDLEMVKGPWPNTYVPKVDLDAAIAKLKEQGK